MYMREVDNPVTIQYIILFTMTKAARRVTHSQLTCLTLDSCNINFANFEIALDNLIGIDYIKKVPNPAEPNMPIYELTEKGVQANGFFESSIPIYIREQISEHIAPYFEEENLKKSVKANILQINEREFSAKCSLFDSTSALMELNLYSGDRKTAAKMVRNFKKNPEKLYTKIIEILTEDEN